MMGGLFADLFQLSVYHYTSSFCAVNEFKGIQRRCARAQICVWTDQGNDCSPVIGTVRHQESCVLFGATEVLEHVQRSTTEMEKGLETSLVRSS